MANIELKSNVSSVTIYSDRVMVTRHGRIELDKTADIVIPDLPGALDDQTVRVRAKELKVGEIQVKTGYAKTLTPAVKKIEDKIKNLKIEDRGLADEVTVLHDKQKFLGAVTITSPNIISKEIFMGKLAPDAWRQALQFVGSESVDIKKRIAEIELKRQEIKEKIDALNNEMNDIAEVSQNSKSIIFDVHPEKAQAYELDISYILYGASWRTYYELRSDTLAAKVNLSYFGKISQRTGEDWEDTGIILSTALPALGGTPPEPSPWYVNLYVPRPKKSADRMMAAESRAAPAAPAGQAVMDEEFEAAPPVDTGIAVSYPLPGKYTLKSGEPEKKLKIVEEPFDAEFEYVTVPRYDEHAYATGKLKNTTDYLFLSGEGSTYVGDDFTGKTALDTIAPGDTAILSFGVDDRVKVERKLKKSDVTKGGLVKKATRYEYCYENTIKNFHKKEIKCKVLDQIPIAQHPDIKVTNVSIEPKPTSEKEAELGIYEWVIPIAPEKETKITIAFTVETPVDSTIEGL
ncbi:MAG TPA: mucoidy inhibitor MuiA family protein [bacterium]